MKSILGSMGVTLVIPEKVVRESAIVRHMKRKCENIGAPCERLKGQNGWFDYIIFWNGGVPTLVETKKPKNGRYEPLQLRTHAKFRKLGYSVAVLLTKDQVNQLFRKHGYK